MSDGNPMSPEAFSDLVLRTLRRAFPGRKAEVVAPLRLVVDGRTLTLENLHRMALQSPQETDSVVVQYLERVLGPGAGAVTAMPFSLARTRIMPRIQPDSIFEELDRAQVAHLPFVNDTSIVFVVDLPDMTVTLTVEQLVRWGVGPEELDQIARENLGTYAPELEARLVESKEGGRAAVLAARDGYDASRLLLDGLHDRLAPTLGRDFLVGTPARDVFVAITARPDGFVDRVRGRIDQDFRTLPYPITQRLFLVTQDGVAGTLCAA